MSLFEKLDEHIPEISNGLLLFLNIFFIFLIPFFPIEIHKILNAITFSLIFLISVFALNSWRKTIFSIAIIAVITEWVAYAISIEWLNLFSTLINIIFFQLIVIKIIIQIAESKKADSSVIFESINGYLMLGLLFTTWVAIAMILEPTAFSFPAENPIAQDYTYFTFVTMTTLGYGDVIPQLPFSRAMATFISTAGQIYIAVIIAMLVGKYASTANSNNKD
ncbi:MAG: potassium channel family protein [Bacteroidetes bacterium]|nr:potassium channel family protein [Bacteroidota bacterium]